MTYCSQFDCIMFTKLFRKSKQTQQARHSPQPHETVQSMGTSNLAPRIDVHYGIPSTASVLAFDPIQRLLAVGTLDGRIKVIGGDNIEGLFISSKAVPFKYLEFLQNQGFLVSVSSENEIQVWDLDKRCIASNVQWESNITSFSVISGTNYMYAGDEYGFLSVLKHDSEEGNILQLPYHVPPNLIAEGAGIPLPDNQSIVGVLSQPSSCGNRVLIAYGNGLIILWDVTEDRAIHVKGNKDLELKESVVLNFSNKESHDSSNNVSDDEEAEKEISSLCWVSPDGSVLAVGYVDGDILLWDLSVPDNSKIHRKKSPNDVVKIQLSSEDRRLPVIVLHWSSKAQTDSGGQLFVYGGEDIGSEEVLTILDLDWSSGLAKLKCIERVDLRLHGSFADILVISNASKESSSATSLFVLTNPGQLLFYEYSSLAILKSESRNSDSIHSFEYHSVIPTEEPYMTMAKLYMVATERNISNALSEAVSPAKQQSNNFLRSGSTKWPVTGGVMHQTSTIESNSMKRIFIGGCQDGSVRIWDATLPVLSLFSVLGPEVRSIEIADASASISALDLFFADLTLAVGNQCGVIFLYSLDWNSSRTSVTILTESKHDVRDYLPEERSNCSSIFSVLKSPVLSLQFATSGIKLFAGFECGKIVVLDTRSPSVLFVIDCMCSSSPIISVAVRTRWDTHGNAADDLDHGTGEESAKEIAFILTRDAHVVLMDGTNGNIISSHPLDRKEKSVAISMHLLEADSPQKELRIYDSNSSCQNTDAQNEPLQTNFQSGLAQVEEPTLASLILLCCEEVIYLYSFKSLLQGSNKPIQELKLEKPCAWTTIFKNDEDKYGVIIVYQTGDIEIRSLAELELLYHTSMMSLLRWNFKNNMDKTMSSSDKGLITLINGREFAVLSLLASENECRSFSLHDKVLAAATNVDLHSPKNSKKRAIPGFVNNMIKGLKGVKAEQAVNFKDAHEMLSVHLESIFSRFPFSEPYNSYDLEEKELNIDDIEIDVDDPIALVSSSQKESDIVKEKESERQQLFEGGSQSQPRVRTREEIIAKYRKSGDAASAASQAKDKLLERQEKLEKLSRRTEDLQNNAENFASLAQELAKAMEKRKWWNI